LGSVEKEVNGEPVTLIRHNGYSYVDIDWLIELQPDQKPQHEKKREIFQNGMFINAG
jgi:hypothetical protein